MSLIDQMYVDCLRIITASSVRETRNGLVKSSFRLPILEFSQAPILTKRKVAIKMALDEWAWFMSGNPLCPDGLRSWWGPQLASDGCYYRGYGQQFRGGPGAYYDQMRYFLTGLREHPFSRRLLLTSWNPEDMEYICDLNNNPATPTTCHTSFLQAYVEDNHLSFLTVQRSADFLLGVPHNWVQTWAFLLYSAYWSGLKPGVLRWVFGDAHVYQEESHLLVLDQWLALLKESLESDPVDLEYVPNTLEKYNLSVPEFLTSDFKRLGDFSLEVKGRPTLL